MSVFYFPGCKVTLHSPENSRKIRQYLMQRYDMRSAGCCNTQLDRLTGSQTAVYICPTCGAFMKEYTPETASSSVWENLENDDAFPWPDYGGEAISVQDCWRSFDNRPMQNAIRHILKRMNVEVVEIGENFEKTNFCGISLMKPQSPRYARFAPVRFIERAGEKFIPKTEPEKTEKMKKHARQFTTAKVVCYCTGCLEGLEIGGVNAVHLLDLVTANLQEFPFPSSPG